MRVLFLPMALYQLASRRMPSRRWWDPVDEHVLIGALPLSWDVPFLAKQGVKGVINLCDEYTGPQKAYDAHGIEQIYLPTVDFCAPSLTHVETAVDFIQRHQANQGRVFVHCKAGRGRSATVVICYLIQQHNLSPQDAQQTLKERRPRVISGLHKRKVVQQFAAKHTHNA